MNKPMIPGFNFKAKFLLFIICASVFTPHLYALNENDQLLALTKQIIEAKSNEEAYAYFEELRGLYFSLPVIKSEGAITKDAEKNNRYNDFINLLKSLSAQKKALEPVTNYYIAYTRYYQLKYLEENQLWDEYFSKGNDYRAELTESAQGAVELTSPGDILHVYSWLILWQFHRDQQDVFSDQALTDLMNSALEYCRDAYDIVPVKDIADKFNAYGEKAKSKELYKIYVDKLFASDINEEKLIVSAENLYQEGNFQLSKEIYDAYIKKIEHYPKEKLISVLFDIAKKFSYDDGVGKDALYAEEVFKKIEASGGKEAFNEEAIYSRAFNLEKAGEYNKAKDIYIDLMNFFPEGAHYNEANFKVGIIFAYISRDIKNARNYLEKLAQKEGLSAHKVSSLYQLGLLSQWEQDNDKAKEYYNKLLQITADGFGDTAALAKERLGEIEGLKPIEYNLKTFLDLSLKEGDSLFDMAKLELKASVFISKKNQEIGIVSKPYTVESGCMQVELQYLWSGHLGTAKPSLSDSSFNTIYNHAGTKEINLVVVSPSGIVDRAICLVDVYPVRESHQF